jgi:hypothetical protein
VTFFVDENGIVEPHRLNENLVVSEMSSLSGRLWYLAPFPGCVGDPFLEVDSSQMFLPYVRVYGTTGYIPSGLVERRDFESCRLGPLGACECGTLLEILSAPAVAIDVSSLAHLVPPFRVEGP